MTTFLDKIEERRNAAVSVAHKVALYLVDSEKRAIITEAGDDHYFYSNLFHRRPTSNRTVGFFSAQGRDHVLGAAKLLEAMGKGAQSFAILDRDFNFDAKLISDDGRVMIIEYYSYENFFANKLFISDYGNSLFGLEENSKEKSLWLEATSRFIDTVQHTMCDQHALALWCRLRSKNCNLGNYNPRQFIEIDYSGFCKAAADFDAQFRARTSADCLESTPEEINECRNILDNRAWYIWFRGHYFFGLLVKFLNSFRRYLDEQYRAEGKPRVRTRSEITDRHALDSAVGFLPTPALITQFFDRVTA